MAMHGKLRRSLLSDRLELRLLLVAQHRIEVLERGPHQVDRLLHRIQPPVHCVKASGWGSRVLRQAFSVQDVDSPGVGDLQRFESGALSVVRVQPGLDLVRRPLQHGWLRCAATLGRRFRGPVCGGRPASILGECIEPCFLFVFGYCLTPLSTTALFTAAGIGKVLVGMLRRSLVRLLEKDFKEHWAEFQLERGAR